MPTTPVAKEKRPQVSHLHRESDPRAPPHFPPSPPIPAQLFKTVPSPATNPIAIPPSPDVEEFVPPSPLFSPPPRPHQSSSSSSSSSPRVPAPSFSSPAATTSNLGISCSSSTISPAKSLHGNNFNNVSTTSSSSSTTATTATTTTTTTASSSTFTFSPIVTSSRPRTSSTSSPFFLPLPKSPALSPNSPPTSPALNATPNMRTPERSPRRPAPQLPSHAPPSSSRKNSQSSPLGPSTTPNFPPPPVPTSPKSPPSATVNLLASLSSTPLQSPPPSSSSATTTTSTTTPTTTAPASTTATNTTTTTITAISAATTGIATSVLASTAIILSSTIPALATSTTAPFPSNPVATTTTSSTPTKAPVASTSSASTSVSETPAKPIPPPPSIQTVLSPANRSAISSPVRVRGKHPSNSPTHLKIRSASAPPPLVVKSPDSASMSSFSSSPSSSGSASSAVAESSSFSANNLSSCAPIPEGSSEFPESPSNEHNQPDSLHLLRESSSSPPVPSSWGKEFRPDGFQTKPPPILCGRCEKVVEKQKPTSVEEVKKVPTFHSPIYEDPTNVSGNLKMSRQGLSKRLPMKTRWCVFHPALCTLWYWRTSVRGPKSRCLFVTGVTEEKTSLQFSLLLQFRGRVLVQASSESDFELWKQGFARAFDTGDNQEALRIVLPPEDHKTDGFEARESGSIEIRPRASTLDRVRSIFVQEFNNTLWKPNKSAKKKSVAEARDETKGELWHVGSVPLVRVDVP